MDSLLTDLALILVVAGAVTVIFKRLHQPLVLGYIVAGFLVSPQMPYIMTVVDKADVQQWADIGVIFLLFALGLDFSFKKILKMGVAPIIAAVTIIFCMMMLGITVGKLFDWQQMDCIFLGGMLAMSSTTIIYKAFDDMGIRQQHFASLVMSVLILEDILAIVLMVMLSAIAQGNNPDGGKMLESVLRIGFFLVLWFVVGIFLIPAFLRRNRKFINDEVMVVLSIGLCCLMAVISHSVGFSTAFGAFVMGSILAETVEADKIIKLVEPVKSLFGAIFFVSVGMLVDPHVLVEYALPILALVATIIMGQVIFGSLGYLISGQPLKTAMKCGFSMAQIGEFAFIIASLGLSLHVIGDFIYPVVVAVSVITTFLTPYMIRAADPCYQLLERHLPRKMIRTLNHITVSHPADSHSDSNWKRLLHQMLINTVVYSILTTATIMLMFTFVLPFVRHLLPGWDMHWVANAITGIVTIVCISPFLRAMVMKKNRSEEFRTLWAESRLNHLPLIFTIVVRVIIACAFIFYITNFLSRFTSALMITIAVALILIMVFSRSLKHNSIMMERLFIQNLRSRDIEAQVHGRRRPLFEGHLLDRDIHMSDLEIPMDSLWSGRTLADLDLRKKFGIHISSILRANHRLNIPDGDYILFPGDHIQVIGTDEQITSLNQAIRKDVYGQEVDFEKREMKLRQVVITGNSTFVGRTLKESGIRHIYNCMVVGLEEGKENLSQVDPNRKFEKGDILWVVGEAEALDALSNA
jgi:CPA2 family monovalent cation:H+ antiporter-2